jgi:lambda repressor-like predicted transcriptional regulator
VTFYANDFELIRISRKDKRLILASLPGTSDNSLCPIKLLLILALWSGTYEWQVIDEVLNVMRASTVRWSDGQVDVTQTTFIAPLRYVVLPCYREGFWSNSGFESPSREELLVRTVAALTLHDVGQGSVWDTADLSRKIKGLATEAVTAILGQSKWAHDKGITADYVGSMTSDIWSDRVNKNFEDPFGLQILDTPMMRREKFTSKRSRHCALQRASMPVTQKHRGITSVYVGLMSSNQCSSRVEDDFKDHFGLPVADTHIEKKETTSLLEVSVSRAVFFVRISKTNKVSSPMSESTFVCP